MAVDNSSPWTKMEPVLSRKAPTGAVPAQCAESDVNEPNGGQVRFLLLDNTNTPEYEKLPLPTAGDKKISRAVPWHAELTLDVRNLAALLENGLFWSEDNIDPSGSFFGLHQSVNPNKDPAITLGYRHFRHYELTDGEGSDDALHWAGTLRVYAHDIRTLSEFKLGQLSLANVRFVLARDRQGQVVYQFDSADGDGCFNAILGDAPLLGWWPWPKKTGMVKASPLYKRC